MREAEPRLQIDPLVAGDATWIQASRRRCTFEFNRRFGWYRPGNSAARMLKQPRNQRHPHRNTCGRLFEVYGPRIGVELIGEFVGAWQRMHHDRVMGAAAFQCARVEMSVAGL